MYKILNRTYTKLPLESEEQKALVQYLRKKGFFVYASNNENNTYKQDRKFAMIAEVKAKANGKLKGVSDLTVFTKDKIVFIELKRQLPILKSGKFGKAKNDASKEQVEFISKVCDYKYSCGFVAYGCDDAIEKLKEIK